jgi:hypothetical protein
VTPEGRIVADPARGLMMGNRGGALHDEHRQLGRRRWVSHQWICCKLSFKGRQRQVMAPRRYTELFFLDEATALAAGHRPCFECRREDALAFATAWMALRGGSGRASAGEMDRVLHLERVDAAGEKVTYAAPYETLPVGSFVRHEGGAHVVLAHCLRKWASDGYRGPCERPSGGLAEVLTPRSIVAVLAAGYRPGLHPAAD